MKRLHLLALLVCALTPLPIQAQGLVVVGRIVGSDGLAMKAANVTLYPVRSPMLPLLEAPSLVIATTEASSDGSYRLEADTSGVFQLWFSGVDHVTAKTVLLGEPGGQYRVDVALSAIAIAPDAKLAVIGPFNEFSPYRGFVEMVATPNGTYVARLATDTNAFAYEILDLGDGPNDRVVFNGTGSGTYEYDGRGAYKSIVSASGDSVEIEYDPRQLSESPSEETVAFRPDSTDAARFARFWSDLRRNTDEYYDRLRTLVIDGADEAEISRFQTDYDWSANLLLLEEALREIPEPRHRGTLLATYLSSSGGIDSTVAMTALAELAPDAPEWAQGFYTMMSAGIASGRERAYENYYLSALRTHADKGLKPPILMRLIRLAEERGAADRSRILLEWLLAEYPRSFEARRARAEYGLRVGTEVPAFVLPKIVLPITTEIGYVVVDALVSIVCWHWTARAARILSPSATVAILTHPLLGAGPRLYSRRSWRAGKSPDRYTYRFSRSPTMRIMIGFTLVAALFTVASRAAAQTFPVDDPVLQRIWEEGIENSQAYNLAQALLDSIGPRLSGSPAHKAANNWAVQMFQGWGIEARNEQYGTWMNWERGITHIDLVEPRVRTLEGMLLAWSAGTRGKVRAGVVILPDVADSAAFQAWLPEARRKFVLGSYPEPTCRPNDNWEEYATEESFERMQAKRDTARREWRARIERTGYNQRSLPGVLEEAGVSGILTTSWPGGWGVNRVFSAITEEVPWLGLSCEDYGLLYRLAKHDQGPVLEVEARARFHGEEPIFNTVAEIRGTEKPDEYVVFSAHFDSWDGGSGATDNGTGSVIMMEAMRILKAAYPNPKRTIIAGLWGAEEQGLIGSRAFVADHPEVIEGLQVLLNQDQGTGRIVRASGGGLTRAGEYLGRWLSAIPTEISRHIDLTVPGTPSGGGSDHASFACAGGPALGLGSLGWAYSPYTWHTNRDTFDKIVFDDLKNNATLYAMLAYLAAEEDELMPRDQRVLPISQRTGEQMTWPECRQPMRTWGEYRRR